MIPAYFDGKATLTELNALGLKDYKIELITGIRAGYISQVKCGNIKNPRYDICAKLYNLLEAERVSHGTLQTESHDVASRAVIA